jgi:hypothetical protein
MATLGQQRSGPASCTGQRCGLHFSARTSLPGHRHLGNRKATRSKLDSPSTKNACCPPRSSASSLRSSTRHTRSWLLLRYSRRWRGPARKGPRLFPSNPEFTDAEVIVIDLMQGYFRTDTLGANLRADCGQHWQLVSRPRGLQAVDSSVGATARSGRPPSSGSRPAWARWRGPDALHGRLAADSAV